MPAAAGSARSNRSPPIKRGSFNQSATSRTTPDVAFDADPITGISIYDSYDYGAATPWVKVGGTSFAAPAWAALIAIADQARSTVGLGSLDGATQTLPMLYAAPSSDFNDITSGDNGFSAGPGYDLVTGRGTPRVAAVVNDLVGPLQVAAASPAAGSYVAAPPVDFAITLTSAYTASGIAAADLTVNGIAADSFEATGPTTITFHYDASPVTAQGLQTMAIAAGSLTRSVDGSPLVAYNATFRYDALPIAIDALTPADNAIIDVPLTTLDVHFNEPYDPATIDPANLTLSQGTVAGVTLVDSQTVRYSLSGATSPGTLSIGMAAGTVTDLFGNGGPAFSGTLFLNGAAIPFPTPLVPLDPAGSLVYRGSADGTILFAGNVVSYMVDLAAGQALSLSVVPAPGLAPWIGLVGPGVNASSAATAVGAPAALQTVPIATAGTYTISVGGMDGGAPGGTGNFVLTADLNAALAPTASGAAANETLATAQDLDAGFTTLAGSAERAAVDSPSAVLAGPNDFGYAAAAVASQFDEISATGTALGFITPSASLSTQVGPTGPAGISFPFYGTTYNTVYVNPHGVITLARVSVSGANTDLTAFRPPP